MATATAMSVAQLPSPVAFAGLALDLGLTAVASATPIPSLKSSRLGVPLLVELNSVGIGENIPAFETTVLYGGAWDSCYKTWALPTPQPVAATPNVGRSRELRFRETHRELLRSLAGQWVCLEGDSLIAHGPAGVQVVETARARGVRAPYVFRVPDDPPGAVPIGL